MRRSREAYIPMTTDYYLYNHGLPSISSRYECDYDYLLCTFSPATWGHSP